MPPRYAYWTIIAGGLPTAFRAAAREELLPTFQRIKEKHPDAQMKYFARGKLWESPEAARATDKGKTMRGRDWRPGGNHRDPRQKFIDAKKQRNATVRKARWERRGQGTEEPAQPPRPRGPNREPKPSEDPQPTPPPAEEQPTIPPTKPPERGHRRRGYQPQGRFRKGPRR